MLNKEKINCNKAVGDEAEREEAIREEAINKEAESEEVIREEAINKEAVSEEVIREEAINKEAVSDEMGSASSINGKKRKKSKKKYLIPIAVVLVFALLIVGYVNIYYHADCKAVEALESTGSVKVAKIDRGYSFTGENHQRAMIFYPGAKVEYIAYAPLMQLLAAEGLDCYLMQMPCNLAFLGLDYADDIMQEYTYDEYYIAGHSLGGAMAAAYCADGGEKLSGLILLGAYPAKKLPCEDFKLLTIYGSKDGVLNLEKYNNMKKYWPSDSREACIVGGNHAYYGNYGSQKGDNTAELSRIEQQRETAALIINWISDSEKTESATR